MAGSATALDRHGITCNAVAPGMILADMTKHHRDRPEPAACIRSRVPVGRIGHAVVLLAGDGDHQAGCV